jgi:hypothetical protein
MGDPTPLELTLFALDRAFSHSFLTRRHRSLQPTLKCPRLRVVSLNLPPLNSSKKSTKGLGRLGDRGAGWRSLRRGHQ